MTGELLALGANHKTAPLPLRERLALPEGRASRVLAELVEQPSVHEAVAISTCNRTELYLMAADAVEAENVALGILSRHAGLRLTELLGAIYSLRGDEAVEHLFSVAAGLDSMIVGEAEVQGQVKRAYELALVEGVTGPVSNRLFRDALATGKRVRSETGVSRSNVSVSSVAVQLAAEFLGNLEDRRVLVVGAGENAELTARALSERGVEALFVANRRYERALALAQRFGGRAISFDDMPNELEAADIVVSSTGAPHQIVGRTELEFVAASRMGRPLVLLDLAVPRDIDPAVAGVEGASLHTIDDLESVVARTISLRHGEADRAREIVAAHSSAFRDWMAALEVVPAITSLRAHAERIRVAELERARLGDLTPAERDRLDALTQRIVNKLLHRPTVRLKELAADDESGPYAQAVTELFGLAAAE
jgi:glutamyl-tRNA reductase